MKHHIHTGLMAVAALSCLNTAQAQSTPAPAAGTPTAADASITPPKIYGRISTALESARIGDSGSRLALKSYSSRLGLRGEQTIDEDSSLFYGLEAQVFSDSGANGLGGDLRNAYMGLRSKEWGTLVAGRLDPLVSAPLYVQMFGALDLVGMDTGNLQILAVSGRDTGTGSLEGRAFGSTASNGTVNISTTQTLLARSRVSNAVGYTGKYKEYDIAARFVGDGPNDVVGLTPNMLGENSARSLELAATKKGKGWMAGAGFETNSYSAPVSATSSRFGNRFQLVSSVMWDDIRLGATYARNTAESNRAGVKKNGNEFAVSAKKPIMGGKAAFMVNYALRDLFGTDNYSPTATGVPRPLPAAGAKRKQFALGVHYDINPQTQSYAVYNLTDGSNKASDDELKVIAVGVKHNF